VHIDNIVTLMFQYISMLKNSCKMVHTAHTKHDINIKKKRILKKLKNVEEELSLNLI